MRPRHEGPSHRLVVDLAKVGWRGAQMYMAEAPACGAAERRRTQAVVSLAQPHPGPGAATLVAVLTGR